MSRQTKAINRQTDRHIDTTIINFALLPEAK